MISLFLLLFSTQIFAQTKKDDVLGKWIATDKSIAVQVCRQGNDFKAKVIWFDQRLGSGTPMNSRHDMHNPDAKLRTRKVLGMDILNGLNFNSKNQRWENGKIYDVSSGRTFDNFVEIQINENLYIRDFWKFSWIGKMLYFERFRKKMFLKFSPRFQNRGLNKVSFTVFYRYVVLFEFL